MTSRRSTTRTPQSSSGRTLLFGVLVVALGAQAKFTPTKSDSRPLPDPEQFKAQAVPLVQSFIFSRYDDFAASKLTFRHLKEHVAAKLQMPYAALKLDALSAVIEDATDVISNVCDGGKVAEEACRQKLGLENLRSEL